MGFLWTQIHHLSLVISLYNLKCYMIFRASLKNRQVKLVNICLFITTFILYVHNRNRNRNNNNNNIRATQFFTVVCRKEFITIENVRDVHYHFILYMTENKMKTIVSFSTCFLPFCQRILLISSSCWSCCFVHSFQNATGTISTYERSQNSFAGFELINHIVNGDFFASFLQKHSLFSMGFIAWKKMSSKSTHNNACIAMKFYAIERI